MKKAIFLFVLLVSLALMSSFPRSQTALRIDLVLPDGTVMIYAGQEEGVQVGSVYAVLYRGEVIGKLAIVETKPHLSIGKQVQGSLCFREWDDLSLTGEKVESIEKQKAARAKKIEKVKKEIVVREEEETKQQVEEGLEVAPSKTVEAAPGEEPEKKVEKAKPEKKKEKPAEPKKEKPKKKAEEPKPKKEPVAAEEKLEMAQETAPEEETPAAVEEKVAGEENPAPEETPAAAAGCPAKIIAISGACEMMLKSKGSDQWAPAELNACLEIGDMVRTGEEGLAAVGFGDNPESPDAQVNVNKSTTLTISLN